MKTRVPSMKLRGRLGRIQQAKHTLSIAKEGFVHRGANLFNRIDENLRKEEKTSKFLKTSKPNSTEKYPLPGSPSTPNPHRTALEDILSQCTLTAVQQ